MTPTSNPDLTAITTQDSSKNVYLLVANRGQKSYTVDAEFSELITTGTGTMWKFSSQVMDELLVIPSWIMVMLLLMFLPKRQN